VVHEVDQIDRVVYAAVAGTTTPALDRGMRRLSDSANNSRLWLGIAAGLAFLGPRGRRAAISGACAIGVTSALVNLTMKTTVIRGRPDRAAAEVAASRHVRMPTSTSFPSGHAASAFAFATAVGDVLPPVSLPLHALAAGVAYSRVHTGVHYPGDVMAGSLIGALAGAAVGRIFRRSPRSARTPAGR
jgi:membrane-associated phospholipid phosphatase